MVLDWPGLGWHHNDAIGVPNKDLPMCPSGTLFGDNPCRVGAWADGNAAMPVRPNPFAAEVDALSGDGSRMPREAVQTRRCRELVGVGGYDEAAERWRPRPSCPRCKSGDCPTEGRTPAGHARWECGGCGLRFGSLSGTVFENAKKALWRWVLLMRPMCLNARLDACAELCGISHQTAWERRHRVMATIDGYQDRIVLRDKAWVDETCVTDSDLKGEPGWRPRRGLSRNKICIAVAIDAHKNVAAVRCGRGKPSARRIKDALRSHIAEGAEMFHDMEKSHKSLVRAAKGVDRPCKADTKDPEYPEHMAMVNNLCSWIRRYLRGYVGMDLRYLQSYLNWYAYPFRVKQAEERWPKVERVLRHLVMADASFRSSRKREQHHTG